MTDLSGITPHIFAWLFRSTVQASVLVLLILMAQALLRTHLSARWRSTLWLLLVVRLLLPWSPESSLSVFNLSKAFSPTVTIAVANPGVTSTGFFADVPQDDPAPAAVQPAAPAPTRPEGFRPSRHTLLLALAGLWALGALAFLGRVVTESIRLSGAVGRQTLVTGQFVLDMLEQCKQQMGVHPYLAVVESPAVASPALFGWIRPRLVLPEGATQRLSREELRFVFLHELGHLKRLDIALNWITVALQAIHWFNPLLWYAFHRMRGDREMACDALVLSRTKPEDSVSYGRTILSLLHKFAPPRPLSPVTGILEDQSQLKRRITMIAHSRKHTLTWSIVSGLLLILLGCSTLTSSRAEKVTQTAAGVDETSADKNFKPIPFQMVKGLSFGGDFESGDEQLPVKLEVKSLRGTSQTVEPGQAYKVTIHYTVKKGSPDMMVSLVCYGTSGSPSKPLTPPSGDLTLAVRPIQVVEGAEQILSLNVNKADGNKERIGRTEIKIRSGESKSARRVDTSTSDKTLKPIAFKMVKGLSVAADFESGDENLPVKFKVISVRGTADTVKPGEAYEVAFHYTAEKGTPDMTVGLVCYGRSTLDLKPLTPPSGDLTLTVRPIEVSGGTEQILSLNVNNNDAEKKLLGRTEIKLIGGDDPAKPTRRIDKTDYPFVDDPDLIGKWESVDFVETKDQFKPGEKQFDGDLYLKDLSVYRGGKTSYAWTWTKGLLLHRGDKTASAYEIKDIDGTRYLFMEWKSGDYTFRGEDPQYYVLKQVSTTPAAPPARRVDKIDYPFVNDPEFIGQWESVDFVKTKDQFTPGEHQFQGDLYLKGLKVLQRGKTKGPWRWTKGLLLHPGDKTASKYEIKDMDGTRYLFMEWKSGDYTLRGMAPEYYVLKKVQ